MVDGEGVGEDLNFKAFPGKCFARRKYDLVVAVTLKVDPATGKSVSCNITKLHITRKPGITLELNWVDLLTWLSRPVNSTELRDEPGDGFKINVTEVYLPR